MAIFWIFWIFCFYFLPHIIAGQIDVQFENQIYPYSQAIVALTKLSTLPMYVSIQGDPGNRRIFEEMKDEVNAILASISNRGLELSINTYQEENSQRQLIFLDGYNSFLNIYNDLTTQLRRHEVKYMFCLFTTPALHSFKDMKKIMKKLIEVNIMKVTFLLREQNDTVAMYRMHAYSPKHCNKALPVLVTKFKNGQSEHRVTGFPAECRNLHKCPLKIFGYSVPPFFSFSTETENATEFGGFEGELIRTVAQYLNFSIQLLSKNANTWGGNVYKNASTSGPYEKLRTGMIDIHIGGATYSPERVRYFDASNSYLMSDKVAILKKRCFSHEYANWFYDPYQQSTWILIGILMLILAIMTSTVNSYGHKIDALMRLIAIILGVPINNKKSKSRFGLSSLLLALFVLRSAYVGKIYDSYSQKHCEKPPATITDLILNNFTIITHVDYTDPLTEITVKKTENLPGSYGVFEYWNNLEEEYNVAILLNFGIFINYIIDGDHFHEYMILKEAVFKQQLCAYFRKHSCLVEPFNDVFGKLITSGIIAKWRQQYNLDNSWRVKFRKLMSPAPEPVPMTLMKMRFAFYSFEFGLLIASFAFLMEILLDFCKRKIGIRRLK